MPSRRCRRSLANELAEAPDQTPAASQRPKRKAASQPLPNSLAEKKFKFEDESVGEVKAKSFYGKSTNKYLNPIERKDMPKMNKESSEKEKVMPLKQSKISNANRKTKTRKTATRMKKPLNVIKTPMRKTREPPKKEAQKEKNVNQKENSMCSSPFKSMSSTKKFFKSRTSPRKRSVSLGMGKAAISVHRSKGFQMKLQAKGKRSSKEIIAQSLVTRSASKTARRSFPSISPTICSTATVSDTTLDLKLNDGKKYAGKRQSQPLENTTHQISKYSETNCVGNGQSKTSSGQANRFTQSQDIFTDDSGSNDEALISNKNQVLQLNCSWKATSEVDSTGRSSSADSVNLLSEISSVRSQSPTEELAENLDIANSTKSSGYDSQKTSQLYPIFGNCAKSTPVTRRKLAEMSTDTTSSPGSRSSTPRSLRRSPKHLLRKKKDGMEQMTLDFGQKSVGPTQCSDCGMTYTPTDHSDTATHAKFHHRVLNTLKFPGWKKERVLLEYPDGSRVILIMHDEKGPMKKVRAIKDIVDADLGFVVERQPVQQHKTFLFISPEKRVIGFCIAELISEGNRVLREGTSSQRGGKAAPREPWCCSTEAEPAHCGINRIWTLPGERRLGVASKLLDVVRQNFLMGYLLDKSEIAFSDPTPDGRNFAAKYTGTPTFLVYKHN